MTMPEHAPAAHGVRGALAVIGLKVVLGAVGTFVGGLAGYWLAAGAYEISGGQFGYEFEGVGLAVAAGAGLAVLGAVAGVRAAGAALRRGAYGLLMVSIGLAVLIGGGAGATATTEAWQRRHAIVKVKKTPYECRHDPPYPRYCREAEPYTVRHGNNDIPPLQATAGGMAGASAGAVTVSTTGLFLLRHRRRPRHPTRPRSAVDPPVDDVRAVRRPIVAGGTGEASW